MLDEVKKYPVAKRYQEKLDEIKKNVEDSYQDFRKNHARFHEFRNFVFRSTLTDAERTVLTQTGKPILECNIAEAYISRLRGEFSKQMPSIMVGAYDDAPADPMTMKVLQGHIKHILSDANKSNLEYNIWTDLLSGGFSVVKMMSEYVSPYSFQQKIIWKKCPDPTLCGFDKLAMEQDKSDGKYCFEFYPMSKEDFKKEFPHVNINDIRYGKSNESFQWAFQSTQNDRNKDILIVCKYHEKKPKSVKIHELSNGEVVTDEKYKELQELWKIMPMIQAIPEVVRTRKSEINVICRYIFIANQVIEYQETDLPALPLVFFSGNAVLLREKQNGPIEEMTRPYLYNIKDTQRLKNFAVQNLANFLENMIQHKLKVAKESIPPEYVDAYTNPQVPSILIYNAYKDNDTDKPLPAPQEIAQVPMPPEIMGAITLADQTMQTILGTFDAALGINDNQLSGIAIVEGATQSNSASMPFIVGFMQGLTRLAQNTVDWLPRISSSRKSLSVLDDKGSSQSIPVNQSGGIPLNYDENVYKVNVEAGVNFAIQKARALNQLIMLMKVSPTFEQFMNQEGLEVLLDNIEIHGIDQLKPMVKEFIDNLKRMQQQEQEAKMQEQKNAMNPLDLKAQEMQLHDQQKKQEFMLQAEEINNERMKIQLEAENEQNSHVLQEARMQEERFSNLTKLFLSQQDQTHKHTHDKHKLMHEMIKTKASNESKQKKDAM